MMSSTSLPISSRCSRRRSRLLAGGLMLLGVLAPVSVASAIPSYSYETDVAGIGPGQSVNIYLRETLQAGDTSLITQYGGLFGAGFAVRYVGGIGTINLISVSGNPALFGAGSFTSSTVSNTAVTFLQSPSFSTSTFPTPVNGRILLGSVSVASTATGLPAVFSVGPIGNTGGGNTVTLDTGPAGISLDLDLTTSGVAYNPATSGTFAVISLVPEPGLLGLFAPVAALLIRRR